MAQNLAMFAQAAQGQQPQPNVGPNGQPRLTPAEMAQLGRFGDSIVAHLTPGEIAVPPQVQTRKLMETLRSAFKKAGVSEQQFMAGSPTVSHNPATGAPEFNFLGGLLSPLLGVLGGVAGTALGGQTALGATAGSALGSALGGGAGALMGGLTPQQALFAAAGGALGNYAGGLGKLGAAARDATAAAQGTGAATAVMPAAAPPSFAAQIFSKPAAYTAGGAMMGSMLAPGPAPSSSGVPAGFNNGLPAINQNFNALLGNNQASRPTFQGYNPYASVTGSPYNFYAPAA